MKNTKGNRKKSWRRSAFFSLVAICCLSIITGCRDNLLPTQGNNPDQNTAAGSGRILITSEVAPDPPSSFLQVFTTIPGSSITDPINGIDPIINLATGTVHTSGSSRDGLVALMNYQTKKIEIYNGLTGEHLFPDIPLAFGEKIVESSLTISPDGTKIAYGAAMNDGDKDNDIPDTRRIIIANRDGTVAASFSPAVADFNYIRFSPDGKKIAYFGEIFDGNPSEPNSARLYVANIDLSDIREIAPTVRVDKEGLNTFDWSPDGTQLVYVDPEHGNMYIINSDGTGKQSLGFGIGPDWSPDGKEIIFTNQQMQVARMTIGGGGTTTKLVGVRGVFPRWSPDGKQILYFEVPEGSTEFHVPLLTRTLNLETKLNLPVVETKPPFAHWIG